MGMGWIGFIGEGRGKVRIYWDGMGGVETYDGTP